MSSTARPTRRGFSLVELMFAVMLLGFGLIGIAATLSVGGGMTMNTVDESAAARTAQNAASMLSQCMTDDAFPVTDGSLKAFTVAQYGLIQRQLLAADDRRFAWIPMYSRKANSRIAQIVIAVVRAKNQSEFNTADSSPNTITHLANLMPTSMQIDLSDPSNGPITATFGDPDHPDDPITKILAPGALVILNAKVTGNEPGRIYRIGNVIDASKNIWSLAPGYDTPGNYHGGSAFVIGRGYADATNPIEGNYDGPSQAIAGYATFVMLK